MHSQNADKRGRGYAIRAPAFVSHAMRATDKVACSLSYLFR